MNFKYILFLVGVVAAVGLSTSCQNNYHEQKRKEQAKQKSVESQLEKANKGLISLDSARIVGVIRANNWNMKVTETGLRYEILQKGRGVKAKPGMQAIIDYKVRLLDGRLVYTSDSTGQKKFVITKGGVERGLEEGILLLNQGDSVRFIMPPYMAHHLLGDFKKIPPRSTIIYEVRLNSLYK